MTPDADTATITRTCPGCGASFTYDRHRGHGQRRYCSPACRDGWRVDQMRAERAARYTAAICRNCGTEYNATSTVGRPRSVYCSDVCKELHRAAMQRTERRASHGERDCAACGKPIPDTSRSDALTCSRACGVRHENALRAERARRARSLRTRLPCPVCGTAIDPARRRNVLYCSEACKRIAVARKYHTRHPDAAIQARYGMQPGEYEARLAAQGGRCAICGAEDAGGKGGRFHVDHDHVTGGIRGLLCHGCNIGIGMLRDDPEVMRAAIRYVERKP